MFSIKLNKKTRNSVVLVGILVLVLCLVYCLTSKRENIQMNKPIDEGLKNRLDILYSIGLNYTKNNRIDGNVYIQNNQTLQRADGDCKIKNIGKLIKNINNFLEVGFNAGHSCLTALHYNTDIKNVLLFDINHHKYTEPTYEQVKKWYNNTNFQLIKGDSTKTIPQFKTDIKYDFIHIDGGHSFEVVKSDIINCKKFAAKNHILLIDDSKTNIINSCSVAKRVCSRSTASHINSVCAAVKYCIDNNIIKLVNSIDINYDCNHIVAKYVM